MSAISSLDGKSIFWEALPRQDVALSCPAFEVLFGGQKGGSKALSLDTRIPTPDGWIENEFIQVGDTVFGEDGKPVKVLAVTDPFLEQAYRLHFSDGTSIVCGESHLWKTMTALERRQWERRDPERQARRRAKRPSRAKKNTRPWLAAANSTRKYDYLPRPSGEVRKTSEIVSSISAGHTVNHSIAQHAPLELPANDFLTIPPYTLGAWLGDGSHDSGRLSGIDREIWDEIEKDGYSVSHHANVTSHNINLLVGQLRDFGLLKNKHIPSFYMRSSFEQRLALLQGLMDTDGMAAEDGSCFFTQVRKSLFDGFVELARSLGIIVKVNSSIATCTNSKTRATCVAWKATFTSSLPVFRLPRKLARQNRTPHFRYQRRFITHAESVGIIPLKCIQIDSPSGMFLAGDQFIPTHNSDCLIAKPVQMLALAHQIYLETGIKQERCRIVIFRRNIKHLTDLITRAKEIYAKLDPEAGHDGWSKSEKRFTFTSGAFVEFDHLDGPDDHQGYNGQELRGICIDQCEELSFEVVQFLRAQVRTSDPRYADYLFCFYTANPGGKHAQWVKDYFIKSCPPNKIVKTELRLKDGRIKETTRAFIPSALKDNPYLNRDGSYEANLRTLPVHMQQMYLDGDWDAVVGAHFSHVWRPNIHAIDSFPISDAWEVKFGLDWGSTAPAAALFGTKDEDGNVYIIDELYGPGVTGRTFGEKLKKKFLDQKWGEKKRTQDDVYGLIDWHAFSKNGAEGMSPGHGIMSCGFRLFDANKDRIAGWEQVIERLLLDSQGKPKLYIFKDRCPNLVRTLPAAQSDKAKPDDIDTDGEDHALDALRYLLMDWPVDANHTPDKRDADVDRWLKLARAKQRERELESHIQGGYGS